MNSRKELQSRWKIVPAEQEAEDQHGLLNKRFKFSSNLQSNLVPAGSFPIPPPGYNPLDEPSPLGLQLTKTTSLLDMIHMQFSRGTVPKKEHKATTVSGTTGKFKASNFSAFSLKIGSWEFKQRYKQDLVVRCYFAQKMLIWEILDGDLKSKMEIQWSNIKALKANYPDDETGTLDIVLATPPCFFRETDPEPKKHTIWRVTPDFTDGQASIYRQHFLRCPQVSLRKNFEKLIQCDPHLNFLSQQEDIVLESPYFQSTISVSSVYSTESNHGFKLNGEKGQAFSDLRDAASSCGAQSSPWRIEQNLVASPPKQFPHEAASPISVISAIDQNWNSKDEALKGLIDQDQIKMPGFHFSLSMNDIVSPIEHPISEQITSDNFILPTSDEQLSMSRVDSLTCLLQMDSMTAPDFQEIFGNSQDVMEDKRIGVPNFTFASEDETMVVEDFTTPEGEFNDVLDCTQALAMSEYDPVGELLLDLPSVESLPRLFFNISKDSDNQASDRLFP